MNDTTLRMLEASTGQPTHSVSDEGLVLQRLRSRLSGPESSMPPFTGPWATGLVKKLLNEALGDHSLEKVLDKFANDADIDGLFFDLEHTNKQHAQALATDPAAVTWSIELACFLALRCVDASRWMASVDAGIASIRGDATHATVARLRTRTQLVAAVGWAGLNGLSIRVGPGRRPVGVHDLTAHMSGSLLTRTDVVQAFTTALYSLMVEPDWEPRENKEAPLSDSEMAKLRRAFAKARRERQFCAPFVQLPALDSETAMTQVRALALAINNVVIHPEPAVNTEPLLKQFGLKEHDLEVALESVFRHLPGATHPTAPSPKPDEQPPAPRPEQPTSTFTYDLFISHASQDKPEFVEPLVRKLEALDFKVWYDRDQLLPGDSLRQGIDKGLRESRFVVVVLSSFYVQSGWAAGEFDSALSAAFSTRQKRVIPVWLNMTLELVRDFSFLLADKIAINATGPADVRRVAAEIARVSENA